jgi:hypothetical protein
VDLQRLLDAPREHLSIEIKGWLNLEDELDRANLAKAMLALANHGGGLVLIGWTEHEGNWRPDEPRPQALSMYSQDSINAIVAAYAEPVFHCDVDQVSGVTDDPKYPLVRVPGSHRVPIRAKRDDPERKHVRVHMYYIRRPGPASEPPQTAREWDELIRRCVLSAREELLDDFRRILQGQTGGSEFPRIGPLFGDRPDAHDAGKPDAAAAAAAFGPAGKMVEEWHNASTQRWRTLVTGSLSDELASRYQYGTWSVAYALAGHIRTPPLAELRNILVRAERHETGYPLWWVPTKEEIKPRPFDGLIECWIKDAPYQDGAHSDFWRASPTGLFFSVRGHVEDAYGKLSPGSGIQPGTVLDVRVPIWRVSEVLLHAVQIASDFSDPPVTVAFRFRWEGLRDRKLASLDLQRQTVHSYTSKQDCADSMIVVGSDRILPALPEIVGKLTRPLYEIFDFFALPAQFIESEIANFRRTRKRTE